MARTGHSKGTGGSPSIFISHCTRDADLAEAFARLLKNVCADEIRVFRSSDTSHGIPYSKPWFPAILSEIDAASAMVCLLTRRSVERPWILWEAGTAFGKGKPVYQLAIGIPEEEARVGPFAQFHICADHRLQVIKLVKELLPRTAIRADENGVTEAVRDFLRRTKHVLSRGGRPGVSKSLKPDPEVSDSLKRMNRSLFAVDGMIEVCRSIRYSGWTRNDMLPPDVLGQRRLPDEFYTYQGEDAKCEGGSQARFTLKDITEPLLDGARPGRRTVLALSSYADLFRLSRLLDRPFITRHGRNQTGRDLYGTSWFPLQESPLVHNVNAQPIIITSDKLVLLAKRGPKVDHYAGCWSASIEEQMIAPGDERNRPDASLCDCAERGVQEELNCTPDPRGTRVLSVGIEHANMSASFICLVRVEETFQEACGSWLKAEDPYEIAGLDCLPLEKAALQRAISHRQYSPGDRVCIRRDGSPGDWHPTARMRLYALLRHMDDQDSSP